MGRIVLSESRAFGLDVLTIAPAGELSLWF